jgi:hypothetical protein
MANLEQFKSVIKGGVRPNQFRVLIDSGPFAGAMTNMQYLCHAATLPGSIVGVAPAYHRGRMIPLGGERTFNPWTITIYADQALAIRTLFERWSNVFNDYEDNTGETDPTIYKGSAIVTQMERNDDEIKRYHVIGMFPTDVGEIQLGWNVNDQLEEFTVTFTVERVDPFMG